MVLGDTKPEDTCKGRGGRQYDRLSFFFFLRDTLFGASFFGNCHAARRLGIVFNSPCELLKSTRTSSMEKEGFLWHISYS